MIYRGRRKLLKIGAGLPLAAMLAPGLYRGALAKGAGAAPLRVATYGGSWRDNVEKYMCAKLIQAGVKIEFIIGNPNANLAKLIAAHRQNETPFDVMDGSPLFYRQMVNAGMLEKVDYAKLPHAKGMPAWVLQQYQVEPNWTTEGVVYNAAKFREAGVPPPEKYTDLMNPKLKGRVAYPDPAHVQHWGVTVALAYESGGSESNMSGAIGLIKKIDPVYYYTSSVDLAAKFGSGDIWAAPWGASWAVRLKESGQDVAVAYTKIGDKKGALWPATKMIIKGAQNLQAARGYLDAYLADDSSYGFCMEVGNVPASAEARQRMAQNPIRKKMLLLSDAQLENAFRVQWDKIDANKWRDTWNRGIHA